MKIVIWAGIVTMVLLIFCFYFTLTFIENLHIGDGRILKQSKLAAVLCFGSALFIILIFLLVVWV